MAGLCAGAVSPEQWGQPSRLVDFYDVKADVESLLGGSTLRWETAGHPALHPGRSAKVFIGEQCIGVVGELHPRWVQKYELATAPIVFELEVEPLLAQRLTAYRPLSNFPVVTRDLALVVGQELAWQTLLDALKSDAPAIVKRIELFDVYAGKGITEGRKSLAFRIVMQDTERTLEDAEVDKVIASLVSVAEQKFSAQLRN